jgi:hypothetical protein
LHEQHRDDHPEVERFVFVHAVMYWLGQ